MAFFYLGDWPSEDPFDQTFYGALIGVCFWVLVSLFFLRGFADVRSADSATYAELTARTSALRARLESRKTSVAAEDSASLAAAVPVVAELAASIAEIRTLLLRALAGPAVNPAVEGAEAIAARALAEAHLVLADLEATLADSGAGSRLRWTSGSGYISLWRRLHRAEEAFLAAESPASLHAEALEKEARLATAKVDGAETLLGELRTVLGEAGTRRPRADVLIDLDAPQGRALVRKIEFVLNSYRDDLFSRFVRIRNAMFATLVYVGLVGDGLFALALVAIPENGEAAVVAGMTYFLVGALVGLFAELYGAQRAQRGAVHDYGLAFVRLLTVPVLSGIAAALGVVLTRLGGAAPTDSVSFEDIFSLTNYPLGIIVAAIFGLTPGLLLERLRAETNEYKEELVKSAAGTPSPGSAAAS